jgi:hypothetical protein
MAGIGTQNFRSKSLKKSATHKYVYTEYFYFQNMEIESESELLSTIEQLDDLNSCLNVLLDSIKNDTSEVH